MKRSLQAVKGYLRHNPERKFERVKDETTALMWDQTFGHELEAALREALAVGDGFELHGGLT